MDPHSCADLLGNAVRLLLHVRTAAPGSRGLLHPRLEVVNADRVSALLHLLPLLMVRHRTKNRHSCLKVTLFFKFKIGTLVMGMNVVPLSFQRGMILQNTTLLILKQKKTNWTNFNFMWIVLKLLTHRFFHVLNLTTPNNFWLVIMIDCSYFLFTNNYFVNNLFNSPHLTDNLDLWESPKNSAKIYKEKQTSQDGWLFL